MHSVDDSSLLPRAVDAPPPIPRRSITYHLSRSDLFLNNFTIVFRKRFLQFLVLGALVLNSLIIFAGKSSREPLGPALLGVAVNIVVICMILVGVHALFCLAMSFLLPHKGVVCRHTLEITDVGLIERTYVNETLHRWSGIANVIRACGSLYIYVSDLNSHQVPIRGFAPGELEAFEAELRQRAGL